MSLLVKVGIVGGTIAAVVAGLILFRSSITSAFGAAGQTVGESFGGFFGGIGQGITESFSEFEFPSFDFGSGAGGAGVSELAGQTVPTGTEGDQVMIPPDTMVSEEGIVTSSTPPVLIPSQSTQEVLARAQTESMQLRNILGEFSAGGQLQLLNVGAETEGDVFAQFAAVRRAALESVGDPDLPGSFATGFFDLPQTEEVEFLPLSEFAFDFFSGLGQTPIRVGGA